MAAAPPAPAPPADAHGGASMAMADEVEPSAGADFEAEAEAGAGEGPARRFACPTDEYGADIYRALRANEDKYAARADYMEAVQRDINQTMRGILVDW